MTGICGWLPSNCSGDSICTECGSHSGCHCARDIEHEERESTDGCSLCSRRGGPYEELAGAGGQEIECLLDSFAVSNSWSLSRKYGLIEGINVAFKGARAFAKVGGKASFIQPSYAPDASPTVDRMEGQHQDAPDTARHQVLCRRCARRALPSSDPTSMMGPMADVTSSGAPAHGRYLFGSVDVVVHMYRPALFKSASHWLRVEVGLLPLRLDAQTLRLLFGVLEGNVSANDPDVAALAAEPPRPAGVTTQRVSTRKGSQEATTGETARTAASSLPADRQPSDGASKSKPGDLEARMHLELHALLQRVQKQHTLQGLLEPQVDFVELLEEWGKETFILELIAQGLHLALCEPPLQQEIMLLRHRCTTIKRQLYTLQPRHKRHQRSRGKGIAPETKPEQLHPVDGRGGSQEYQKPFLFFHAARLRVRPLYVAVLREGDRW